ncbi:MAG: hypothetical protein D3903_13995 [Candidatus Electrothrix sp. GM3_4]|nr:hypothetical protein [Candidatus Electrothrix sp. GM3_4]
MSEALKLSQEKHLREQAVPVIVGQITRKRKKQAEQAGSIQIKYKVQKIRRNDGMGSTVLPEHVKSKRIQKRPCSL